MQLYAVQTGETIWEVQQRLDSLAGVPLSESGRQMAQRVAKELVPHEPTAIYASSGEAEQETAKLLAKQLGVRIRTEPRLDEIDFGLWQGLSMSEIKHRQPKLHKQWLEGPSGVRPPGGESLQEVQDRLCQAVREIGKKSKSKKDVPVIVLRPVALGALRCRLENANLDDLWSHVGRDFTWRSYDVSDKEL